MYFQIKSNVSQICCQQVVVGPSYYHDPSYGSHGGLRKGATPGPGRHDKGSTGEVGHKCLGRAAIHSDGMAPEQ